MLDFYRTSGGRRFVDGTVPRLVAAMERLAAALELRSAPVAPGLVSESETDGVLIAFGRVGPAASGDGFREFALVCASVILTVDLGPVLPMPLYGQVVRVRGLRSGPFAMRADSVEVVSQS